MTQTASPSLTPRNITVDVARTAAIVLMVIFHFIFDLGMFGHHNWNIPNGPGWKQWREGIVTLFLLCVGVSLVFAHQHGIRWHRFSIRLIQIAVAATIISIVTTISHPKGWIFFGILHFITCASVVSLPLIHRPRLAAGLGVILLALNAGDIISMRWPYYHLVPSLPQNPVDFVPLIPWLGIVWIGIACAHSSWLNHDPLHGLEKLHWLSKPGRYSLLIYMVHQPLLVGALYIIDQLTD